ncbi:MAG: small ribosomal subunit Rsm22 family protein [Mycobacteriales bacterium]
MPDPSYAALRAAIDDLAAHTDGRAVAAASARLTESYGGEQCQHVRSDTDAAAYAVVRLPATHAATVAALGEIARLDPAFAPETLLDLCAGSGAGAWAAAGLWPTLRDAALVDADERMLRVGAELRSGWPASVTCRAHVADVTAYRPDHDADLTIAGYVLNELPPDVRAEVVLRAWAATTGALVIVEPGTPTGFEVVRAARKLLIGAGAHLLAPCPHARACPMSGGDWCHFATRVQRSSAHRQAKSGALGHEDEKFSYVAVTRRDADRAAARVLRHPVRPPRRVELRVCAPDGVRRLRIGKSRDGYRAARDLGWGDGVPPDLLA